MPLYNPTTTAGLQTTSTNNNAAAGRIGEFISSTVALGSPVSLTSATAANVTSISLTAGDWDVYGTVGLIPAATTSITEVVGAVNITSATIPAAESLNGSRYHRTQNAVVPGVTPQVFSTGHARISVASTTTVYLIARGTFTVDTLGGFGKIVARRAR